MSGTDAVVYLNDGHPPPFASRLLDLLGQSKQARAPVSQWISTIQAFAQKGVKVAELEESGALPYLQTQLPTEVFTREDLIEQIRRRYYTIKEVLLGFPKYPTWRQPGGNDYREYLYIANSELSNVQDALEDVNFEMEELSFNPELAVTQPERILRLEARREQLMKKERTAIDFTGHHFSDKIEGRHGKNLLAHCRVSIHGDTYFIDEIQSDWAQRGRKSNWKNVIKGPLVTNTEAWSGMVLRRQLQIAAAMPGIKRVAWITESMRNGGRQNLQGEQQKDAARKAYREFLKQEVDTQLQAIGAQNMTDEQRAQARKLIEPAAMTAAAAQGLAEPHDMLNDFYLMVLPKLADKLLGKAGAKVAMSEFVLDSVRSQGSYGSGTEQVPNRVKVPCVEMTPQVRELMMASQPMYSRAPLRLASSQDVNLDARNLEIARAVARTEEMLGSARHLRFAKHVYDVATGHKVAGRYINQLVQVSLAAQDILLVTEHECFHYAADNLMTHSEVALLRQEFADGSALNVAVRKALLAQGMRSAAAQCNDPMEAAAHGFTLWARGALEVQQPPVRGLFSDLVNLAHDCVLWFKRTIMEQRCTSVEDVFRALSSGEMAQHRAHDWTQKTTPSTTPSEAPSPAAFAHADENLDDPSIMHARSRVAG
jgi:hypothetical protein